MCGWESAAGSLHWSRAYMGEAPQMQRRCGYSGLLGTGWVGQWANELPSPFWAGSWSIGTRPIPPCDNYSARLGDSFDDIDGRRVN